MFDAVRAAPLGDEAVDVERLVSVDSTIVRAHQHAAGARKDSAGARAAGHTGDPSKDKRVPVEPADHGLGRSRGGWSTKIRTLADQATATAQVRLTGGQAGDNPRLLDGLDDYRTSGRRPRFRLLADKGYSHPSTRQALRDRKIPHTIPERSDQIARRKAQGSRAGRPPGFDAVRYAKPNTVERSYLRLKLWREGRDPLRQARPHLPRRHSPGSKHHPPQDTFTRHALGDRVPPVL
jgi:transposase